MKDVEKRFGERISDISFWSYEIDNEIDRIIMETNNLSESKRQLEKALADTEQPLKVVQECLYFREKRQAIDLVHDKVERNLLLVQYTSQKNQKVLLNHTLSYIVIF